MTVFWTKGYEGASVADLTRAMGINAPSLYACFGSKEGLFRSVLERYDRRRESFMETVLSAPDAQAVAETFLFGMVAFAADTNGRTPPGCLLVQSGQSCGDADIPGMVARHRAEKEAALRTRFEQAKKAGDLPRGASPAALARYLMAMANGICMQAAAGATPKELNEVAALALAGWPGKTAGRAAKTVREPA